MKVDLHTHSYYSDGAYSPKEVAKLFSRAGCDVIALTDHDTVDGVKEMTDACVELGMKNITGIEISTQKKCEIHILGYNVDIDNGEFLEYISLISNDRQNRIKKILELLKQYKINIDYDYIVGLTKKSVSRLHVATAMVKLGYEKDVMESFSKWMNEGCPCFVPYDKRDVSEAIGKIKACGGRAVLAHPVRLKISDYEKSNLISYLASIGLEGIEAKYKQSSSENVQFFTKQAKLNNLFVTNGGDFHNNIKNILPREIDDRALKSLNLI